MLFRNRSERMSLCHSNWDRIYYESLVLFYQLQFSVLFLLDRSSSSSFVPVILQYNGLHIVNTQVDFAQYTDELLRCFSRIWKRGNILLLDYAIVSLHFGVSPVLETYYYNFFCLLKYFLYFRSFRRTNKSSKSRVVKEKRSKSFYEYLMRTIRELIVLQNLIIFVWFHSNEKTSDIFNCFLSIIIT